MHISGYRFMWVVAMFDLPMDTKQARKAYTQFRKHLIEDGFVKMQFSVYIRHCASQENADVHISRIEKGVPHDGEVRIMTITDKQYSRMRVFWGKGANLPKHLQPKWSFFEAPNTLNPLAKRPLGGN